MGRGTYHPVPSFRRHPSCGIICLAVFFKVNLIKVWLPKIALLLFVGGTTHRLRGFGGYRTEPSVPTCWQAYCMLFVLYRRRGGGGIFGCPRCPLCSCCTVVLFDSSQNSCSHVYMVSIAMPYPLCSNSPNHLSFDLIVWFIGNLAVKTYFGF